MAKQLNLMIKQSNWATLTICGFALICILGAFSIASTTLFGITVNSDSVAILGWAEYLTLNGNLKGQDFPGAPNFFPDLLLVTLALSLTKSFILTMFVSIVTCLFLHFLANFVLFKACQISNQLSFLGALFSTFFLYCVAFVTNWYTPWPGSHLSVIIFSLGLLIFYLHLVNRSTSIKGRPPLGLCLKISLTATLTYLIFVSNNLVLIQGVLPLFLLSIVDTVRRRLNVVVFVVLFSLILFAVVLGFRTPAWLSAHAYVSFSMHQSYSLANALTAISQTFPLFLNALISHIHEFPLVYWPLVAMQAFVVLFILGSLSGPVRKIAQNLSSNPHLFRILLFLFLSEISSIGAGLATAKIYHPSLFRYLLPIYFFPILSFFLVIFSISNKSNVLRKMTFIAVPALVTAIFCGSNFMNNWGRYIKIPLEEPYPASVKCIDALVEKYGLKAGLANYWHVRYVRMLSRGGIGMSEITNENGDGDLIFFNTTDNINFLFVNPNSRVLRSYDFIILANLNRDRVFLNVGKPTEIEQCGAFEVAVFSSKADHLRLNNYFKNRFKDFAEVNSGVMRLQ